MTDKRIKMDCPFCGHDKSDIQVITVGSRKKEGVWVEVRCPECGVRFSGYGKQNIINKWNRRI